MSESPLDLSAGFWAFPRGLTRWSLWLAMSVSERMVVVTILGMARYRAGEGWYGSSRFPLGIGELYASEDHIASEARVTRKIVRTCVRKLLSAGFLARRKVHPAGRSAFVLTVRDYSLLQQKAREEGQPQGQQEGHDGAQEGANEGPTKGQRGASKEQGSNQGNPATPQPLKGARGRASAPVPADPFEGQESGPVSTLSLVTQP